jgi:hypothetical protein
MKRLLTALTLTALALCASARAQTPISALPSATPSTTDAVPFVTMGTTPKVTKKTTLADFFSVLTPGHVAAGNKQGSGSKFQLFGGGSVSANDCAKFDASGNVVSNGGTCAAAAPVQSVFGRAGAVVSAANDYNFNQLAGSAACSQLPALTGDLTTPAGSCASTLSSVVTAGTNTKLTYDAKGRVTAGAQAQFSDLGGAATNSQLPSTISSKTFDNTNTANFKGTLFTLQDATDTTKQARFDLSNVGTGQTRTVNIPNANSTTVQAVTCTSQFLSAVSAQGVGTCSSPAASQLSDYAATTFTPTLRFGGASTGITYTTQVGRYVQVGKQVMVFIALTLTSKGSATGAATIAGLPVSANTTANYYQPTAILLDGSYTGTLIIQVQNNGARAGATDANFTNASAVFLTLTYVTN